ncbi:hypothetical protein DKX38_002451 [Salix brachista]|uniref:Uncharacterized protein n=1 Tax=Salix brachista TaxID=2182728 RepID=A0A5N5NNZ3_9ROSI|nr:hypothetical protein DKX38_002451 [Salix brachista]
MDNRPVAPSNGAQGQQFPSLPGQESLLYNLTFDEVSDQIGNVRQMTLVDSNFHMFKAVYDNPVVDVVYSDNKLPTPMPESAMPATSSDSQVAAEKQCRYTDEMMKKTIERRQK